MGSAKESGTSRAKNAIVKALDSPLLNDNKITGAKNVLLLIVSGANEVTLDEIGEINDFIQAEAGFEANIIMGIGEDQELGDAISVTIVATGFAADQQNNIINTEAKKIVHTLEDEQKATYDFSSSDGPKPHVTQEELSSKFEKRIVHVLEDEDEIESSQINDEIQMDLIPTSEFIKNSVVIYDEVFKESISEEDFIITNTTPVIEEEVEEEPQEIQADLLFDLPLNSYEEIKIDDVNTRFELTSEILDLEVNDAQEVTLEKDEASLKRHVLEDFDIQPTIGKSSSIPKVEKEVEEELQFELKTSLPQSEINEIAATSEEVSPLSLTITELQKRAEDRRNKMKGFNYKFTDQLNKNIDDIERQPAYKRLGISLDDTGSTISKSKTSLATDDNEDIQLKSNNSFLHDNVD
jgi:cell division protein FtsZ